MEDVEESVVEDLESAPPRYPNKLCLGKSLRFVFGNKLREEEIDTDDDGNGRCSCRPSTSKLADKSMATVTFRKRRNAARLGLDIVAADMRNARSRDF